LLLVVYFAYATLLTRTTILPVIRALIGS